METRWWWLAGSGPLNCGVACKLVERSRKFITYAHIILPITTISLGAVQARKEEGKNEIRRRSFEIR